MEAQQTLYIMLFHLSITTAQNKTVNEIVNELFKNKSRGDLYHWDEQRWVSMQEKYMDNKKGDRAMNV